MRKPAIYLDTSVLGGCFDPEFAPWSRALMDDFRSGRFRAVLSVLLAVEVARAPQEVRDLHAELTALADESAAMTTAVLDLADRYAAHRILSTRFRNDMLHIALATVAKADVVVSWNFRHIVRFDKIQQFNAVNIDSGYRTLAIHSPREVTSYEWKDEEDRA